jgi:hypothetical protein
MGNQELENLIQFLASESGINRQVSHQIKNPHSIIKKLHSE